jgi:hypothetical protein
MKTLIVVPAHIPLTKQWVDALRRETELGQADVLIVDDSNGKLGELPKDWMIYDYDKQKAFLGPLYKDFAKLFHKCSACRVFGHLVAYKEGYDFVIGLDSDCVVPKGFVTAHTTGLNQENSYGWDNPIAGTGFYPRGFPYHMRNWKTVCNMGLWDRTLDLNGADRSPHEPTECTPVNRVAAAPIPLSGMNFALTREALPGFLFIPNFSLGKDKFKRIDDIWGGYIFQKFNQILHRGTTYGWPIVDHMTKVDAKADAKEEAGMYKQEEEFLDEVDLVTAFMSVYAPEITYQYLYRRLGAYSQNQIMLRATLPAIKWWNKAWEKYGK